MKRKPVGFVLAAVLVCAAFSAERPAVGVACEGWYSTPSYTGTGSSCSAAQSDLTVQVQNYSENYGVCGYGVCITAPQVTQACFFNKDLGAYQVVGYGSYSCIDCGYICP